MSYNQEMEREEESRNLGDFRLVVSLSPLKLVIRVYEVDSEDYLFAEFRIGSLPANLVEYYTDQDTLFRTLMSQQGVRVSEQKLFIPYFSILLGKTIKKEFMISLGKVQGNEVAKLRNEVAKLSAEVERLTKLQQKVALQQKFIELLSQRSYIYLYSPGQIIPLKFPQIPQNSSYRLRDRSLDKIPDKKKKSSNLQETLSTIEQATVNCGSGFVFIGLARINEQIKQFGENNQRVQFVLEQKHIKQTFKESQMKFMITGKRSPCQFYDQNVQSGSFNRDQKKMQLACGKKGDIFALTVNLLQNSLTWFKNGVSIERGYFTCEDPVLYPFIILEDGIQVII